MKNSFRYILIFLTAALLLWTCKEPEYDVYGTIYGTVTDAETKEPVSGAQVILSPGNLTAVTGSSGSYEFTELEAGQYRLAVSAQDYNTDSRQVTVISGERILCDMQLSPVKQEAGMELSRTTLDFGTRLDELTFDIENTGNAGALDWAITNLTAEWLSVSPMEGSVNVGRSTSVKVTVDRRLIDKDVSTTFNVEAAGGSQAVKVSVSYDDGSSNKAKMRLSVTQLDFGTDRSEMTFDVINEGISEDLIWEISDITAGWMAVTPMNGTTAAGKSSSVKVIINRGAITGSTASSVITVNAEGTSESVEVIVRQTEEEKPQLKLSVNELDFGTEYNELPFEIRNTAETVSMNWEIKDVSAGWLTFSRTSGTTAAGGQSSVIARIDRTLITSDVNTVFTVEAEGGQSKSVNVSVRYENGNDDPDEPGDDNPDTPEQNIWSGDYRLSAEVISCKRNGSQVILEYSIFNEGLGDVDQFRIYPTECAAGEMALNTYRTVITDDNYNQYLDSDYMFNGKTSNQYSSIITNFPSMVRISGRVVIKDFNANSSTVTVKLGVYANISDRLSDPRIYFENIPIE